MYLNLIDVFDVGLVLFFIGCLGIFFLRSNLISVLISIELILLSLNYLFVVYSVYHQDVIAQFYALCILAVAAAESSLGLSILLVFYRIHSSISIEEVNLLKA